MSLTGFTPPLSFIVWIRWPMMWCEWFAVCCVWLSIMHSLISVVLYVNKAILNVQNWIWIFKLLDYGIGNNFCKDMAQHVDTRHALRCLLTLEGRYKVAAWWQSSKIPDGFTWPQWVNSTCSTDNDRNLRASIVTGNITCSLTFNCSGGSIRTCLTNMVCLIRWKRDDNHLRYQMASLGHNESIQRAAQIMIETCVHPL